MMDLKAAIEYVVGLAISKPIEIHSSATEKIFLHDGESVTVELPITPRRHVARTLDDIIALANLFKADGYTPVVWYDEGKVCVVFDDVESRQNFAAMPLHRSAVFDTVNSLASGTWLNQVHFIRLLRVELHGAQTPVQLLNLVRDVVFENGTMTSQKIGRQDESVSRAIKASVTTQAGDIPEEITLQLPIYSNPNETDSYPVLCAIDIKPKEGLFQLIPLPDRIQAAVNAKMNQIRGRLAEGLQEGIPFYYGAP